MFMMNISSVSTCSLKVCPSDDVHNYPIVACLHHIGCLRLGDISLQGTGRWDGPHRCGKAATYVLLEAAVQTLTGSESESGALA
jgi:hypothetical protein